MSEEDSLLAAICAEPREDTPRLVFADWLSEQGGPVNVAWATLIRSQVQLANGVAAGTAEWNALYPRVRQFQSAYWQKQILALAGFPPLDGVIWQDWERGFPIGLVGRFLAVEKLWPRLVERIPIRSLQLSDVRDYSIAGFVLWPRIGQLVSLQLTSPESLLGDRIRDDGIAALVECPELTSLNSLVVQYVVLTEEGAEAILASPHLVHLQSLRIRLAYPVRLPEQTSQRLQERFGRWSVY
jgi:uncharacterized protein (TIGR02996 family)